MGKHSIAIIGVKGLPAFGGSARANENIVRLLKDSYDFTFYVLDSHHDLGFHLSNVNFIILKSSKNKNISVLLYYWKAMLHALLKGRYDLIQMNHYSSGMVIPFLRLKYTVVSTLRGILGNNDIKFGLFANLYFNISEILFFKCSNFIVSVSKEQIPYANKYTKKKIIHIPNGINPNEMSGDQDIKHKDYLLFSAARIYDIKGCHTFLHALQKLKYQGEIIVIGDLEQVPLYKEKIHNLSIGLNIDFIPIIKEKNVLFSYLKNAKLYIFPSLIEGMSNMLLEVASLKTPIITSDIPSNTSIFNENEVLFFETENPDDLSDKIDWALNNLGKMKEKAANAHNKLCAKYTWSNIAKEYDCLYKKILDKNIQPENYAK